MKIKLLHTGGEGTKCPRPFYLALEELSGAQGKNMGKPERKRRSGLVIAFRPGPNNSSLQSLWPPPQRGPPFHERFFLIHRITRKLAQCQPKLASPPPRPFYKRLQDNPPHPNRLHLQIRTQAQPNPSVARRRTGS